MCLKRKLEDKKHISGCLFISLQLSNFVILLEIFFKKLFVFPQRCPPQVVETVEVLTELSGVLARAAGRLRDHHDIISSHLFDNVWSTQSCYHHDTETMMLTIRGAYQLWWSFPGDRGETIADTLENVADALGDVGEVRICHRRCCHWHFCEVPLMCTFQYFMYTCIFPQVAEYVEIAAEVAAAAIPWFQEMCVRVPEK